MKNNHSVIRSHTPTPRDALAGCAAEEGSGTVLALSIIAGVLILTVLTLGAAGAYTAHRRAATAADLSALAAADTLRGLSGGEPCVNAARIAQENGATLAACTEPSRPDTMDVRVNVPITGPFAFLGEAKGQARAGAPDDAGGE
ncbi:MAG: flp pilus-assembly TadE/G-like family protein [Rothia sp. (in: high G+C Gram-positive bacteria)]|uniref:Rv3654c family TadE-like protein n=1 Tax=Rothia sp. (in: high G+C Gram-positive bacteria) TaxID=1885016 RepID=UPI0026DD8C90|nr:Rv3654c family TadE-like protein [Rothia sp. (in: high G+C Gram-positive bacteria)]MDO4883605.1 flp pilus-assembly TadE/G-like family protein [Rothia sp. (in: high G+C Gram-positive bacteria)]